MASRYPTRIDFRCSRRMEAWLHAAAQESEQAEAHLIRTALRALLEERFGHLDPGEQGDG